MTTALVTDLLDYSATKEQALADIDALDNGIFDLALEPISLEEKDGVDDPDIDEVMHTTPLEVEPTAEGIKFKLFTASGADHGGGAPTEVLTVLDTLAEANVCDYGAFVEHLQHQTRWERPIEPSNTVFKDVEGGTLSVQGEVIMHLSAAPGKAPRPLHFLLLKL